LKILRIGFLEEYYFLNLTGITLPSKEVKLPDYVDAVDLTVNCDKLCDIPMGRMGTVDRQHEFKYNALPGECPRFENCSRFRLIPVDKGMFQSIPRNIPLSTRWSVGTGSPGTGAGLISVKIR